MNLDNIIHRGDLNFETYTRVLWASSTIVDPIAYFFNHVIQQVKLIDEEPLVMGPNWNNGRSRRDGISKRLDHFLISISFVSSIQRYRSWVVHSCFFYHKLIVLEMDVGRIVIRYSYKFNPIWLEEEEFNVLVKNKWASMSHIDFNSPMLSLDSKRKSLKSIVIDWEKNRK